MRPLAYFALLCAALLTGCQRPSTTPAVAPAKNESNDATANLKPAPAKDAKLALSILAWNIESGGSDNQVILAQMKELREKQFAGKLDIIALSETPPGSGDLWKSVIPGGALVFGTTGDSDRLCIVYNGERFEEVRVQQLDKFDKFTLNPNNTQRSPLIVHLRDKATGYEFMAVDNHLARGKAEVRKEQALGLSAWAREQNLPLIAVGDYNFDFDFATKSGNEAFRAFLQDGVWKWNEPRELIDSNWDDRDKDGKDNYPDSLLDMVFTAGPAKEWQVAVDVIVRPGDFPDDDKTSDHRPVRVLVKVGKLGTSK